MASRVVSELSTREREPQFLIIAITNVNQGLEKLLSSLTR